MKETNFSASYNPAVPRPRTFSQTKAAPSMKGNFGPATTNRGTVGNAGKGPLSVPRSGCCGK